MQFKTLQIGNDLQEHISYSNHLLPLCVSVDNFDDYFQREWGYHWHDEFEFGVVLNGTAEFTVFDAQQNVSKELRQGDGIFIASGSLHSARGLEANTVIAGFALPINFFDVSIFENMFRQCIWPMIEAEIASIILRAAEPEDQPLLSAIQELCMITDQEIGYELHFFEMACKVWRFLMIRALQEKREHTDFANKVQEQRTKEILSFIHAHFSEHISVDDMAQFAAVSRTECFRSFQTILGKSPVEYLTDYRLSMATTMLINSNRTVSDISYLCGFNSPSYFGKLFRKQCGLTPKQCRMQAHATSQNDKRS